MLSITDTNGNKITDDTNVALINPFRYRGYVYDDESGLYYLQSRYYDPETGRFVNADVYTDTGNSVLSTNMFAYCENDPVNYIDTNGNARHKVSNSSDWSRIPSNKKVYVIYYSRSGKSFKKQAYNCYHYDSKSKNTTIKGVETSKQFINA